MFNLFNRKNINEYLEDYRNIDNAKLIDVRDIDEYESGRIPGSINIPLGEIEKIKNIIDDKDTPLYVYCLSGGRSNRATSLIRSFGYTNVTNIGGINSYKGEIER